MTAKSTRHPPELDWHRAVYQRIRGEVTPVRPSQYDIANACNLRCEGCLFFAGSDYLGHPEERDAERIDAFFAGEAARGINFAQFGGAEPALAVDTLRIAARYISCGVVFTNGTVRIPDDVPYSLHISIWGLPEASAEVRGADVVEQSGEGSSRQRRSARSAPPPIA